MTNDNQVWTEGKIDENTFNLNIFFGCPLSIESIEDKLIYFKKLKEDLIYFLNQQPIDIKNKIVSVKFTPPSYSKYAGLDAYVSSNESDIFLYRLRSRLLSFYDDYPATRD